MWDNKDLDTLVDIAVAAGQEILAVYNDVTQPEVTLKDDNSPLTDADRRAHQLIVHRLSQFTPDTPVLSEESEGIGAQERLSWRRYWLVDPLDGTKEFVNRNGEFTVNIALIDNGDPVMGIVHVPVTGVSYLGIKQPAQQLAGAWKIDEAGVSKAIRSRACQKNKALAVVASRNHRGDILDKVLDELGVAFKGVEVVSMGSSLKICLVAEGKADLYPRLAPTCEWDTAAAHAVLAGAGGEIVDTDFQPLRYNQKDELLNPFFLVLGDTDFSWDELLLPLLQ